MVVGILVVLTIGLFRSTRRRPLGDDPLRRAAARYAAGEIERVEFERIQRDLETARASALNEPAESDGSEPPS